MRWSSNRLVFVVVAACAGCRADEVRLACPPGAHQVPRAAMAHETVKCLNAQGRLEGPLLEYCDNGQLQFSCTYHAGKREGLCTSWHCDGSEASEEEYRDGQWHGRRTVWDAGRKLEEEHYRNGVLEGMRRQWDSTGRIVSEEHYANGQLEGEQRAWNFAVGRWETSLYRDGAFVDVIRRSDAPPEP